MIPTSFIPSLFALQLAQVTIAAQPPRSARDTTRASRDSLQTLARDTIAVPRIARISFDLGSGPLTPFAASAMELSVAGSQPLPKSQPTTTVQLRFVRSPDSLTTEIVNRVGTAARIAVVEAVLPANGSNKGSVVRLYDAQVASVRVLTNDDNIGLLQQRLGLQESTSQLSIELQEAQRQLIVTESLDKRKLSSSLEVAHAHATTDALASRLAVQRQHLSLVEQLLAQWTPVREEIVLTASRLEIQPR